MLLKHNSKIIYQNGKRPHCLPEECKYFFSRYKIDRKTTFYKVLRSKGLGSSGICCAGSNASGR